LSKRARASPAAAAVFQIGQVAFHHIVELVPHRQAPHTFAVREVKRLSLFAQLVVVGASGNVIHKKGQAFPGVDPIEGEVHGDYDEPAFQE